MSRGHKFRDVFLAITVVWFAGGATCFRGKPIHDFEPPPDVFTSTPSRLELAGAINRTDRIQKLQSNAATIKVLSMPALPALSANLALERPRRMRLQASLPVIMGSGMDLGSNEELFWMKVPEGMGTSLYYARHVDFQRQLQRNILPVDPTWVVDALGLTHVDPAQIVEGPIVRSDGNLELRLVHPMPDGVYRRILVVNANGGYVTEQLLYGPDGRLLANASGDDFRFLKEVDCSLPHDVQLRLTPALGEPMALRIKIGSYSVNQLLSDDPRLFAMPQNGNERTIDLTKIAPLPNGQATPIAPYTEAPTARAVTPGAHGTGYRPPVDYVPRTADAIEYRGVYR